MNKVGETPGYFYVSSGPLVGSDNGLVVVVVLYPTENALQVMLVESVSVPTGL